MKKILCLLIISFFAINTFAKKVDVETAKKAAKNLYYQKINQFKNVKLSEINLNLVYTEIVNAESVYYIFNVNGTEGFVILSADDIAKPCIGYSFESSFNTSKVPESFQFYMSKFSNEISSAITQKALPTQEITKEWLDILTDEPVVLKTKSIQPLLIHTWNQDTYYNEL
ncbi:MAG: hypothetical protein COZ21_09605, partial [Bacteroidetes bacterium CG_4_10_14_3_um_filter_31_20]